MAESERPVIPRESTQCTLDPESMGAESMGSGINGVNQWGESMGSE